MRVVLALSALVLSLGCGSSHEEGASELSPVVGAGTVAEVTWHIPQSEHPPLLDGAAEVLTSVARDRFDGVVGRFLQGSPRVYQGEVSVDAGALGVMPRAAVSLTSTIFPSLYYRGLVLERVHVMNLADAAGALRVKAFQETSEAELDPAWLSPEGLGSAWLDVSMSDDPEQFAWGRCLECMTVLQEAPIARIVLGAESLDTDGVAPVDIRVEGELEHVPPELLTPATIAGAMRTEGSAPSAELSDFEERQPGLWQRVHSDSTYVRCKQGGSRLVDFRATWTIEEGNLEGSGISAIEVDSAGPCEPFDYGGGS